jgi:alpha-mannosidase
MTAHMVTCKYLRSEPTRLVEAFHPSEAAKKFIRDYYNPTNGESVPLKVAWWAPVGGTLELREAEITVKSVQTQTLEITTHREVR